MKWVAIMFYKYSKVLLQKIIVHSEVLVPKNKVLEM